MFSDRQKPLYWLMWAYKVHSVALLTNIIKKTLYIIYNLKHLGVMNEHHNQKPKN